MCIRYWQVAIIAGGAACGFNPTYPGGEVPPEDRFTTERR